MDFSNQRKIPDQRRIIDRRAVLTRIDDLIRTSDKPANAIQSDVLALFKDVLAQGKAEIRQRFDTEQDNQIRGLDCVQNYSFLIDQSIRCLYDYAFEHVYPVANPTEGEKHTIVAVGGYGRGELAPHSDIDLLFLLSYKLTPHTEQIIEFILYMLWDLGLKVGHATRSVEECMRMAKSDLTIRTSLLEARYLWGDNALYRQLRKKFLDVANADSGLEFVEQKLAERDARHKKLGDSRYFVEPNVKEGKGGLRDLHTLFWIAKYIYGVDEVEDLIGRNVFTKMEAKGFRRAHAFLTTTRCQLHYLTGRAEERLTFDVQPELGRLMGYADRLAARSVERFMKHYYLVAKEVGDLTRIFCAALEEANRRKPKLRLSSLFSGKKHLGEFVTEGGWLKPETEGLFRNKPVQILQLFHTAQSHGLDIHPAALRQITQSLKTIDHTIRDDPEANAIFIDMLMSGNDPAETLKRLNEAGVLGQFIPDFGRVVAQMQHDMYHVYTVDEHTIRAIDLLHQIEQGALKEDHPLASVIIHKISSRRALYVAIVLHDIAKGRGGDHSVLGEKIAQQLCPRFGLSAEETETVAWLVRHHLHMSMTAQKRDIDDPKTIADFAELMQSPERLRLLLVLTVADMRATGPTVWNGWKAALLRDLYDRTLEVLSGETVGKGTNQRVAAAKEQVTTSLDGWNETDVERFLALGYPNYWLSLDGNHHSRHAELVGKAMADGEKMAIDVQIDHSRAVTEITVYTPDHPGLFSQIAGAIALSGGNIVDAKIFTMANGHALDIFTIQDIDGRAYDQSIKLNKLKERIRESLTGALRPWQELAGRESLPTRVRAAFDAPPRVIIDNTASNAHSLIEVNGRDRPGLLYDVTRAITECNLQISSAKISTFGERVVDVFYVKDVFGMKVDHAAKHDQIRATILDTLIEGEASDVATPQIVVAAE